MFHITLFFTYGVSLKTWAESGLLQREIRLYQELKLRYGIQVQFLTYGDAYDRQWEAELQGIRLLPVYERLRRPTSKILSLLQTFIVPWVFRHELRRTDLLKTNQIWGGWVAVLSKWFFRKKLLVRCGYEFYNFSRMQGRSKIFQFFAYWISRFVYSQADQIHVASSSDHQLVEKKFRISSSLIELSPNWIDVQHYKPLPIQKVFKLLFVGRINFQKNPGLLLESLHNTKITLDLVGKGEEGDLLAQMALEKAVSVNFIGTFPNDKMPELYNRYHVYVLCSRYEGNPKTLLEAMACGCAVVGTDVPGIREVIHHGETGLLVAELPDALRSAIQRLMSDHSLRKHLGKQARQYILEHNSLETALSREYSVYERLVKS